MGAFLRVCVSGYLPIENLLVLSCCVVRRRLLKQRKETEGGKCRSLLVRSRCGLYSLHMRTHTQPLLQLQSRQHTPIINSRWHPGAAAILPKKKRPLGVLYERGATGGC